MTEEGQIEDQKESEGQTEHVEIKEKAPKSSRGRYVFECQKCGKCCEKKEVVVVSMEDLKRWNTDVTLPSLYQFLSIEIKDNEYVQISLKKPEDQEGKSEPGCPMYDSENKICNIYFSMPLYCRSFPLGYDGDKYFLKDSSCPGIGKGKMNEKTLQKAREAAKSDFEARVETTILLPVINGLALKFLMEQSKRQIDSMTKEQKDKLKDILGDSNEKDTE